MIWRERSSPRKEKPLDSLLTILVFALGVSKDGSPFPETIEAGRTGGSL